MIAAFIARNLPRPIIRACYVRLAETSKMFWVEGDCPANTNEYQLGFWDKVTALKKQMGIFGMKRKRT